MNEIQKVGPSGKSQPKPADFQLSPKIIAEYKELEGIKGKTDELGKLRSKVSAVYMNNRTIRNLINNPKGLNSGAIDYHIKFVGDCLKELKQNSQYKDILAVFISKEENYLEENKRIYK